MQVCPCKHLAYLRIIFKLTKLMNTYIQFGAIQYLSDNSQGRFQLFYGFFYNGLTSPVQVSLQLSLSINFLFLRKLSDPHEWEKI